MTLIEIAKIAIGGACTIVLAFAAVSDVRRRLIPNWTVLAVIGLYAAWCLAQGGAGVVSALEAAGIALAVTIALYAFKIVGAGDSKLFAAVALFAGIGYLPLLAVSTSLAGGAIALISLASRPQRALVMFSLRGKGDWGRGVPYGVAIALGGAAVLWAPYTGLVHPIGATAHSTAADVEKLLSAPQPQR